MSELLMPVDVGPDAFIRGAGRMMVAGITIAFPTDIGDIINLSSFAAQSGWEDAGATKTGITLTVNHTEETFDVDQVLADIDTRPTAWEVGIGTNLAESTLERYQLAWEGSAITTGGGEKVLGIGEPRIFTKRMLAVIVQKDNFKLRAYVLRKALRAAQESSLTFNKTGEQHNFAVRFRGLADTSIADARQRIMMIFDQT
jgi:hypothetical protein